MGSHGLRRASRCGARGRRLLVTAAGRRRAVAVAQPLTGWSVACGLRFGGMPASEELLGEVVADGK
jgi:hypothetical protein